MNICILVPELTKPGGVASYYAAIKPYLPRHVVYFTRGVRKMAIPLPWFLIYLIDYLRFLFVVLKRILKKRAYIYVINTSMAKVGCTRDAIFLTLLSMLKQPYIVFFRGWDENDESWFKNSLNRQMGVYLRASKVIVLSKDIADKLRTWGYAGPIELESTVVDDRLLMHPDQRIPNDNWTLLFMSRVEKAKGVYECIDAFRQLKETIPHLKLVIAGVGTDYSRVKDLCEGDNDIAVLGYLSGKEKADVLLKSDIFLFPSTHGEGMPNVVLEAMASGLPILTTKCSGIRDFFQPGRMGEYLENDLTESIVQNVLEWNGKKDLILTMSEFNTRYARDHFLASKTALRLVVHIEKTYTEKHG